MDSTAWKSSRAVEHFSEPHDAYADAPIYPPDKRLFKKLENHEAAIALHYMHYNFCRIHKTLRVTPAIDAGLTDHVRDIEELVALLG